MKNNKYYIFVVLLLCVLSVVAQNNTIQRLAEIEISDIKLRDYSKGNKLTTITDSILAITTIPSLTELLRQNTTIYFKENGIGGVSSASFRGTNASHTAVVWNGLNINSQLNGQTDFNTVSIRNYDNVIIRSGGGGVAYGSGAIGGTIHLASSFKFKKHLDQQLITSLGSFRTTSTNYKVSLGTSKLYSSFGLDYVDSKNDHDYLGERSKGRKNENGEFTNYNLNFNAGYILGENNIIKLFQNTYIGRRNFSGSLLSPSDDAYRDNNTRTMLQWNYIGSKFTSSLSVAYLYEKYRFLPNKEVPDFSFGKSVNSIFKYDFNYRFSNKIKLKSVIQHEIIKGIGSDIQSEERKRTSLAFLFTHQLTSRFDYGINLRQEVNEVKNFSFSEFVDSVKETYTDVTNFSGTNSFRNDDPFIFSINGNYQFSDFYAIKFNTSKNFRIPTFNDLYWNGAGGLGNSELTPEKAIQAEVTNIFNYKEFDLRLTGYFIKTKDLIVWRPISQTVWSPINVSKVYNYGAEATLNYNRKWKNYTVSFSSNYAYTISENQETKNQLTFLPFHSITSSLAFQYKKLSAFYQFRWNDEVFTTTDNTRSLKANDVSNIGVNYHLYSTNKNDYTIGFTAQNIYNEVYQLTEGRPAPNRNYQIRTTIKF